MKRVGWVAALCMVLGLAAACSPATAAPTKANPAPLTPCTNKQYLLYSFEEFFFEVNPKPRKDRVPLCGQVPVPLDRSGSVPGEVKIQTVFVPSKLPSKGTILALTGGPGQAGASYVQDFFDELGSALDDHDLLLIDQRGTGRSGTLICKAAISARFQNKQADDVVDKCAQEIGNKRFFYRTQDSVDDIEAVRQKLGLGKLSLYGTSYGTKVALNYAQRYSGNVERLMLDSIVPPEGIDPFYRSSARALRRVLPELCRYYGCSSFTNDPAADFNRLITDIARGPYVGTFIGADGRRHQRKLGRATLLGLMLDDDFSPSHRAQYISLIKAADDGDRTPLIRALAQGLRAPAKPKAASISSLGDEKYFEDFNPIVFLATACDESPVPWTSEPTYAQRLQVGLAYTDSQPADVFYPFDTATGRSPLMVACARWGRSGRSDEFATTPLPDVPALLLSGRGDLRTPSEDAESVKARLPHSQLVEVANEGHSLATNIDCAGRMLRQYAAGRPIDTKLCDEPSQASALERVLLGFQPPPPLSLDQVKPDNRLGGKRGRTLAAVEQTVLDFANAPNKPELGEGAHLAVGGLRAGRAVFHWPRGDDPDAIRLKIRMRGYSYVPGVSISTRRAYEYASQGMLKLKVGGSTAARGWVNVDLKRGRSVGRLGGKRFRARFGQSLRIATLHLKAKDAKPSDPNFRAALSMPFFYGED